MNVTYDTVQAKVKPELKAQAEAIFQAMGLKTSEAIRLFLQQTVNSGGLPFQPTAKIPNAETIEAIQEAENNPHLKLYGNFKEIRSELEV